MKSITLSLALVSLAACLLLLGASEAGVAGGTETCSLQDGAKYEGAESCKKCHFAQHMSWKKTTMANAFETLKPGKAEEKKKAHGLDVTKDYSTDPVCVACHTTGYGKPGGYPAIVAGKEWTEEEKKLAKEREGVQCESCHGPGSLASAFKKDNEQYQKADVLAKGLIEANADNCKSCHNDKSPTIGKDYKFDFEALTKDPTKVHKHTPLKFKH